METKDDYTNKSPADLDKKIVKVLSDIVAQQTREVEINNQMVDLHKSHADEIKNLYKGIVSLYKFGLLSFIVLWVLIKLDSISKIIEGIWNSIPRDRQNLLLDAMIAVLIALSFYYLGKRSKKL